MARILLVEDDPTVRLSVSAVLGRAGHEVVECIDGSRAIAALEAESFDLVITDIIMPDVEGLEVIRAVRTRHPECPIIAMSGGGNIDKAEILTWAEKLGARAILAKPFTGDMLRRTVEDCLRR
ncbi:MAG: response regulator [Alphaproteobacteria bacterium]